MDANSSITRFLVLIFVMIGAGILGSMCRHFLDSELSEGEAASPNEVKRPARTLRALIIPGIAGAFIVPLFLSIGKSDILSKIIKNENFFENVLVVFGFCMLASASAKSFINTLANKR